MPGSMERTDARPQVRVRCRLFGHYAEALGREVIDVVLTADATVADAVETLRADPAARRVLPATPLAAVNLRHVPAGARLADGDELALLPPLAGG